MLVRVGRCKFRKVPESSGKFRCVPVQAAGAGSGRFRKVLEGSGMFRCRPINKIIHSCPDLRLRKPMQFVLLAINTTKADYLF